MSTQDDLYWQGHDFINVLVDQIPAAIFWKDKNSIFLGCNKYFADFAALSSPQDIIGRTDYDLPWGEFQADLYIQDDQQVVLSRQPKLGIEEPQTLSNGDELVLLTNKIPLFSKSGQVVGILGIYHDITSRKKMELSLQNEMIRAELASRAKTEFIANMSHDIRTPLSGLVGLSKFLEQNVANKEHQQYARWINESGEQLLGLLNSILDVVATENENELDLHHETFDLRRCVEDIVQLERPSIQFKNIDLCVSIRDSVPKYVISDHKKIHRILLNLVGNSIKFTQFGSVSINVSVLSEHDDKVLLRFSVNDTGVGIGPESINKVFERFYRVDPSYKGSYSGHGVGLHIAKSFVELLGGELHLESQLGVGTTFHFDLLIQKASDPVLSGLAPTSCQSEYLTTDQIMEPTDSLNAPHILIVEDNMIALRMAEMMVAQAGGCFTSVTNGEDALDLAKEKIFDLIITDIGLSGISGHEVALSLRQWEAKLNKTRVPIIGLTAHTHERAKYDCMKSGMDDVFCKPIGLQTLRAIIRQFVVSAVQNDGGSNNASIKQTKHGLPQNDTELFELGHFALLDVSNAVQRLGNEELLREMLLLMAHHEMPTDEITLQQAYKNDDWDTIEKIAHKMKGGAVYCGTTRLQYACQYLERYRKTGQSAKLEELYIQLLNIIFLTKQTIIDTYISK